MAGSTVSVGSVEIALTSEMESLSARKMKAAYLQSGEGAGAPGSLSRPGHMAGEQAGPEATLYLTTVATRTRAADIKHLLGKMGQREESPTGYFYTVTFVTGLQLDDPSTTRLITATFSCEVAGDARVFDFSPKRKEVIPTLIGSGAWGIALSPLLDLRGIGPDEPASGSAGTAHTIVVGTGPDAHIRGTFSGTSGLELPVSAGCLLEYQGMRKNERTVDWEMYPPMIPVEGTCNGTENLAIFSMIVQTPRRSVPVITARIAGRVKGDLWGVIHLNGTATVGPKKK